MPGAQGITFVPAIRSDRLLSVGTDMPGSSAPCSPAVYETEHASGQNIIAPKHVQDWTAQKTTQTLPLHTCNNSPVMNGLGSNATMDCEVTNEILFSEMRTFWPQLRRVHALFCLIFWGQHLQSSNDPSGDIRLNGTRVRMDCWAP